MNRFNDFNDWLGDKLSYMLSTMAMVYGVTFLVTLPLFFQRPSGFVAWTQYLVSVIFQGVALPILGVSGLKNGDIQAKLINEIHDTVKLTSDNVIAELSLVKEELQIAKDERDELRILMNNQNQMIAEIHKSLGISN